MKKPPGEILPGVFQLQTLKIKGYMERGDVFRKNTVLQKTRRFETAKGLF